MSSWLCNFCADHTDLPAGSAGFAGNYPNIFSNGEADGAGGILMLRGVCAHTVTWRSSQWGLSPLAI
jgi:hypothetical protein